MPSLGPHWPSYKAAVVLDTCSKATIEINDSSSLGLSSKTNIICLQARSVCVVLSAHSRTVLNASWLLDERSGRPANRNATSVNRPVALVSAAEFRLTERLLTGIRHLPAPWVPESREPTVQKSGSFNGVTAVRWGPARREALPAARCQGSSRRPSAAQDAREKPWVSFLSLLVISQPSAV